MSTSQAFPLSNREKELVESILEKIENEKNKKEFRVVSFNNLFKLLNKRETDFINQLINLDLVKYGIKGKYFGIQDVPKNLVEIENQKYKLNSEVKIIDIQYLPQEVFSAYTKLNNSLYKDERKKLLIESGYRSSAYQMFVFLWYVRFYKFDFTKAVKRAAIPGYSEHGFPKRQAIDFMTEDGSPSEENPTDFEKTIEYRWLLKNAKNFHFYLSYPRGNKLGTMFEPWHWAYLK